MCASRSVGPSTRARHAGRARIILCIGSNAGRLKECGAYLQDLGYQVLTAMTGELGLTMACGTAVDLVLLDCQVPAIDGGEVARWLREIRPDLPVIMVSDFPLPEEITAVVDGVVYKGQSVAPLAEGVERHLRARPRRPF